MKFAFIKDNRDRFDVEVLCAVFDVTPAGFYAWLKRPESGRAARARELCEQIRVVHREVDGIYGSIKIARELRSRNHRANRKTIARLMARMGIRSKVYRKFRVQTTDSDHVNPIAPNTLDQNFALADAPDKVWGADITCIETDEGFLYLAGVMDLFSRRIVGWSMDDAMTTKLVGDALSAAISSRKPSLPLLHHSDRGVQYTSGRYRELLEQHGIEPSMSRTGNCYDSAMVESFWGKLKTEMVYHRRFKTKAEARAAVFDYIEAFYNRMRLHAALGYLSTEQIGVRRCG
ncbi:MAG: IS3 family transposase [Phycisphaeraceae bacterium]|nr:IS3 family transposase [Phycisphaeraceae bacterium]